MILPDPDRVTDEMLMLWIMHEFAEVFKEHAILKGGMQLMLLSSERATNDLDYVFTPYASKKEVEPLIDNILSRLPGAHIEKSFHSNSGRYLVSLGKVKIQIEYNVAESISSTSLTTRLLANRVGFLPKVIRVMSSEVAFAHKLAAWNERRLLRDLYDCFYWYTGVGVMPDEKTLENRLQNVNSRLPFLKRVKQLPMNVFLDGLQASLDEMTEDVFLDQLRDLISLDKIDGLFPVFRTKLRELAVLLGKR